MMPLEDRLTAAFREKAAGIQPGTVPPLRPVPGRALRRAPGRRPAKPARLARRRRLDPPGARGALRWLAPAASAVLVIAVIAGAVVVSHGITGTRAARAGTAGVPRYYVALNGQNPHYPGSTTAAVRVTTTGAVLARVTPPRPYSHFTAVAGAANDRTFVLVAQKQAPHLTEKQTSRMTNRQVFRDENPASRFYALRIGTAGRGAQLKALPALDMPAGDTLFGMALSPDGTRLAVNAGPAGFEFQSSLKVFDLVTGTHRSWSNPGFIGPTSDAYSKVAQPAVGSLAWTADNRTLSFIGYAKYHNEVRLLHVSAPGPSLLANSQFVPATRIGQHMNWRTGFITPDGKTIIGVTSYLKKEPVGIWDTWQDLVRYSATTGAGPTALVHHRIGNNYEQVLWASSSGQTLVVTGARPGATAGIFHGHRYTRIPWSASILTAAW
jgi:hypothetical protein